MRQSRLICLSILLTLVFIDSSAGQSDVVFVAVTPMSETQVEISFTPPVTGTYSLMYLMMDCNQFSSSSPSTMNVNGTANVTVTIPIPNLTAGQDVSAKVNTSVTNAYRFAVGCGKSYYSAPSMPNIGGLVDTAGTAAIEITLNGSKSGITLCEVEYRLMDSGITNSITTTEAPSVTLNVTGLESNLAYQVRGRCGVNGPSDQVSYGPYTDWKLVLAAPIPGSICNGQQPVGMSVVTIAVLLVCAVLARHIPALNL